MRAQRSVVAVVFFGGKGAVPVFAVATRRAMRGTPPVILLACSSASVTKQYTSNTQTPVQRTHHSRKNTEEVVALKLKPRI
jgi:hypothetical protein